MRLLLANCIKPTHNYAQLLQVWALTAAVAALLLQIIQCCCRDRTPAVGVALAAAVAALASLLFKAAVQQPGQ